MIIAAQSAFQGVAPKIESRLLPGNLGDRASNCKLWGGAMEPWSKALSVGTLSKGSGAKSIFRMDDQAGGASKWMNWLRDVDVVRGFVDDGTQEILWSGDAEPRMSNYATATSGADFPTAWYVLGVPAPATAPTVSSVTGGSVSGTWTYVYTFVELLGTHAMEGPQSSPVSFTGNTVGATWNLTLPEASLNNTGAVTAVSSGGGATTYTVAASKYMRVGEEVTFTGLPDSTVNGTFAVSQVVSSTQIKAITGSAYSNGVTAGTYTRTAPHNTTGLVKRLYRADAVGTYRFVFDVALGTTVYADTMSASTLALNSPLVSQNYDMPPVGLKAIREIPGLIMVGYTGNTLCISEPGKPHAWPTTYRQNVAFPIAGLGVYDGGVVIGTTGPPYMASGRVPETLVPVKLDLNWPCLSKRGVVAVESGVLYPTTQGMAFVGGRGARMASDPTLDDKTFAAYKPSTLTSGRYQDRYFGFYSDGADTAGGFVFDVTGGQPSLTPLTDAPTAVWSDPATGSLYTVVGANVYQWDADPSDRLIAQYRTKTLPMPRPVSPAYARVDANYSDTDSVAATARLAAQQAANAVVMAVAETYPGQPTTGGPVGGMMLGEEMLGGSALYENLTADVTRYVQFRVYADGVVKHDSLVLDAEPFSLSSGYLARTVNVEIIATVRVQAFEVGESIEDLQAVAP